MKRPDDWIDRILASRCTSLEKFDLLVIAWRAGPENECRGGPERLAREFSVSPSTATARIRGLHQAGLLERIRRQHAPSRLAVNWSKFPVSQSQDSTIGEFDDREILSSQSQDSTIDTSSLQVTNQLTKKPSPPTPPGREEEGLNLLVEELFSLRVHRPGCVRAAHSAGLSPEAIGEIIAHYRQHHVAAGWGPGALYARLANAHPSQAVTSGWPAAPNPARKGCPHCGAPRPEGGFNLAVDNERGCDVLKCKSCGHTWDPRDPQIKAISSTERTARVNAPTSERLLS